MMSNKNLRFALNNIFTPHIKDMLKTHRATMRYGDFDKALLLDMSLGAEDIIIENGDQLIGYQFLHGPNEGVGGFEIKGHQYLTCLDGKNFELRMPLYFTWNDVMDPNPKYQSDRMRAMLADIVTVGGAKEFDMSISWGSELVVKGTIDDETYYVDEKHGWPTTE